MSSVLVVSLVLAGALLTRPAKVTALRGVATPKPAPSGQRPTRRVQRTARWRPHRRTARETVGTSTVLRLVDDLAVLLRAGATPARAWSVAVDLLPESDDRPAGAVHASSGRPTPGAPVGTGPISPGEQPREALRRLAGGQRSAALTALHAAWSLCEDVGAPLAAVLVTVADAVRQDTDVEADIQVALAAPRATARLLGALPVAGLALGELMGARPLHLLVHTTAGRVCALAGLLLLGAGQWWTRRLVARTVARL